MSSGTAPSRGRTYTKADVREQQLEELVRRNSGLIEEGLAFVDHQNTSAGKRLDVLLVDSGKALVVAELKVVEDDGMLTQALDYYDYVSANIESFARLYRTHEIDPTQPVRLFLIAPDFSQTLVNRCKWLDLPTFLFTYTCLKFSDSDDLVPIFTEREIPREVGRGPIVEVSHIEDHLSYITDGAVRAKVAALLDEIKSWKPDNIAIDPVKSGISIKVNNRVFVYIWPRRKHYWIGTYDANDEWNEFPVKSDGDLATLKPFMRAAMEKRLGW